MNMASLNRRSPSEEDVFPPAPVWMVTFADLMSLMLTFFVLLVALVSVDEGQYQALSDSLRQALGGAAAPLSEEIQKIAGSLGEGVRVADVVDEQTGLVRYPFIAVGKDLPSTMVKRPATPIVEAPVFFTAQTAELSPQAFPVLDAIAARFRNLAFPLRVEGYADDMSGLPPDICNGVAARRAVAVAEYLSKRGIPEEALSVAACSDYTTMRKKRGPGQPPRQLDVVVLDK